MSRFISYVIVDPALFESDTSFRLYGVKADAKHEYLGRGPLDMMHELARHHYLYDPAEIKRDEQFFLPSRYESMN